MNALANLGSPMQWFILIAICLVVFGAKRLPDVARGIGKSLGEFKKARKEFEDELMTSQHEDTVKKEIKYQDVDNVTVDEAPKKKDDA